MGTVRARLPCHRDHAPVSPEPGLGVRLEPRGAAGAWCSYSGDGRAGDSRRQLAAPLKCRCHFAPQLSLQHPQTAHGQARGLPWRQNQSQVRGDLGPRGAAAGPLLLPRTRTARRQEPPQSWPCPTSASPRAHPATTQPYLCCWLFTYPFLGLISTVFCGFLFWITAAGLVPKVTNNSRERPQPCLVSASEGLSLLLACKCWRLPKPGLTGRGAQRSGCGKDLHMDLGQRSVSEPGLPDTVRAKSCRPHIQVPGSLREIVVHRDPAVPCAPNGQPLADPLCRGSCKSTPPMQGEQTSTPAGEPPCVHTCM